MTTTELFARIVGLLERCGISYMLTGSYAAAFHGHPRATQDLDIVIAATRRQIQQFVSELAPSDFYVDIEAALAALEASAQFNVISLETGWKVDLIFRRNRPFSRIEFDRRLLAKSQDCPLYVATAEDVILSKLEWARKGGSARQIEDVVQLLRVRASDLDYTYLTRWVAELELSTEWDRATQAADGHEPAL